VVSKDYIPHHEPFQYFKSTANPKHLPPSSVSAIGRTDQANHQYDLTDFWAAVDAGNLPAVSFVKPPPIRTDIAVVIAYDDSDGWYDHAMGPIVNQSQDPVQDALSPAGCGTRGDAQHTLGSFQDRCGYGPRQPLLVVSPFAKSNFVDPTTTDQSSILRFIEDYWQTDRIGNFSFDTKAGSLLNLFSFGGDEESLPKLFLDPATGQRLGSSER
jgi:phospholipase C